VYTVRIHIVTGMELRFFSSHPRKFERLFLVAKGEGWMFYTNTDVYFLQLTCCGIHLSKTEHVFSFGIYILLWLIQGNILSW